jgi:hypothetical protein
MHEKKRLQFLLAAKKYKKVQKSAQGYETKELAFPDRLWRPLRLAQ